MNSRSKTIKKDKKPVTLEATTMISQLDELLEKRKQAAAKLEDTRKDLVIAVLKLKDAVEAKVHVDEQQRHMTNVEEKYNFFLRLRKLRDSTNTDEALLKKVDEEAREMEVELKAVKERVTENQNRFRIVYELDKMAVELTKGYVEKNEAHLKKLDEEIEQTKKKIEEAKAIQKPAKTELRRSKRSKKSE